MEEAAEVVEEAEEVVDKAEEHRSKMIVLTSMIVDNDVPNPHNFNPALSAGMYLPLPSEDLVTRRTLQTLF